MAGDMDEIQALQAQLADERQQNETSKQRLAHQEQRLAHQEQRLAHQEQRIESVGFRYEKKFGRDELFFSVFYEHPPFPQENGGKNGATRENP